MERGGVVRTLEVREVTGGVWSFEPVAAPERL